MGKDRNRLPSVRHSIFFGIGIKYSDLEQSLKASIRKIPRYRLEDLLAQIKPGQKSPPLEDWSAVEPPWPNDDWSDVAPKGRAWQAMQRRGKGKRAKPKRRAS